MFGPAFTIASLLFGLAPAVDPRVELRWEGPPSCPEAGFHAALAGYLAGPAEAGARLMVRAQVREAEGRWVLDLQVGGGDGTGARQLTADRCETIVDAAAFVVAQAIDRSVQAASVPPPPEVAPVEGPGVAGGATTLEGPGVAGGGTTPEEGPVEAPLEGAAEATSVPPAAAEMAVAPSRRARAGGLRGAVRLRGGPSGVALPGVQAEFGVLVGLTAARWRVDLTSVGRLPVARDAASEPSVGARLALWAIGARGCGIARGGPIAFPLCAGFEAGQVRGRSVGLAPEGGAAVPWAAVTVSPGLLWAPRAWFALTLEAELAVALLRHDWVIRGLPPIHHLGPVEVRGFVGVEFRFGGAKNP